MNTSTKRVVSLVMLVVVLSVCALTAHVAAQHSAPFVIYGWINYDDNGPVNNPGVTLKNLNTSEVYSLETNASSNYYQVILLNGTDINASEILQLEAINGSQSVIKNHVVTQEDASNSGVFNFNATLVTLSPGQQVWYFTEALNTTVNAPYANDGWDHDKDLVMNKTKPVEGASCQLNGQKGLWFYATTGAQTDLNFGDKNWTAKIYTSNPGDKAGNTTNVDICKISSDGAVTVIASGSALLVDGTTEYTITCMDNSSNEQSFTTDDWLGVRVSWSGPGTKTILIYYNPNSSGNDKDSYIISPDSDPGYPIPELNTLVLLSIGLIALAALWRWKKE